MQMSYIQLKNDLVKANQSVIYSKDEMSFLYKNKEFYNQYINSGKEYIHFIEKGPMQNYYLICDFNGIISNWYYSPFIINDKYYNCVEQFMMAEKARIVNDVINENKIMNSTCPKEMKMIGRKIKMSKKQLELWDNNKLNIVKQGIIAKFEQNEKLKEWLFIVKDHIIAEASIYDKIWGIGKKKNDKFITDYNSWGDNLLGKVIMTAAIEIFKLTPSEGIKFELSRYNI
jgi:ribA/ribD-fused uncharacterized protein